MPEACVEASFVGQGPTREQGGATHVASMNSPYSAARSTLLLHFCCSVSAIEEHALVGSVIVVETTCADGAISAVLRMGPAC